MSEGTATLIGATKPRTTRGDIRSGTAQMTQKEIGDMFGVSLQSIQQTEYRALRKIKLALNRDAAAAGVSLKEWLYGEEG